MRRASLLNQQQNPYRRPRSSQTLFELLRTAPRRNIGGVNIFEFSRLGRGGNEDDDEEGQEETREPASRDPAAPLRSHIAAVVAAAAGIDGLGDRERSLRYVLDLGVGDLLGSSPSSGVGASLHKDQTTSADDDESPGLGAAVFGSLSDVLRDEMMLSQAHREYLSSHLC